MQSPGDFRRKIRISRLDTLERQQTDNSDNEEIQNVAQNSCPGDPKRPRGNLSGRTRLPVD